MSDTQNPDPAGDEELSEEQLTAMAAPKVGFDSVFNVSAIVKGQG